MTMIIKGIEISAYQLNEVELKEFKLPTNSFVAKDLAVDDVYYIVDNKHRELVSGLYQIL